MIKTQNIAKPISLEKFREAWLRQLVLHRGIKGSVLRVAIVLGYHINRKSGLAFPGVRTIRRLTGMSTSTISAAVNWLDAHRYVRIQRGRTRNATSTYMPLLSRASEHPVRPVRTPVFAPGDTDLPTYLPKEPLSLRPRSSIAATISSNEFEEREEKRTSEVEREARNHRPIESPLLTETPESKVYRLVREHYGPGKVGLVTIALGDTAAEEILADVEEAIENGDDIGHVLWRPQ